MLQAAADGGKEREQSVKSSVTIEELQEIMASLGMSGDQAGEYKDIVESNLSRVVSSYESAAPEKPKAAREWSRPAEADNPYGAWYVRTHIDSGQGGKLAGMRIAVKDNLLLAGVPLMNGTSVLEGYVPDVDAEIVTRMLDAGASIVGKTTCEAYCFSGGSHTSATGPVRNPHDLSRSAGGSSSGSAVVVATGEVDAAIGCDQGGSIRMPASFSGIVGMKPTWGLVPYTGILGMNPSIDHAGPMTANVRENARLLEVLAGSDGVDSRQLETPHGEAAFLEALEIGDLAGVRIGILGEGFGLSTSESDVDSAVRAAARGLEKLGAQVSEISIPLHARARALTSGALQAIVTSVFNHDGCLIERPDLVPLDYLARQHEWRRRADELPANVKSVLITSELIRQRAGYRYVAQAKEQVRALRAAYDDALETVDAFVLPTTPMKATPLPGADASASEITDRAFAPLANTSAFNNTHHPAISVPCGPADSLPIGMMVVGRFFEESVLYRIAHAHEQSR